MWLIADLQQDQTTQATDNTSVAGLLIPHGALLSGNTVINTFLTHRTMAPVRSPYVYSS